MESAQHVRVGRNGSEYQRKSLQMLERLGTKTAFPDPFMISYRWGRCKLNSVSGAGRRSGFAFCLRRQKSGTIWRGGSTD